MKRLVATRSWQPTIVTINETGVGGGGGGGAVTTSSSKFPRKSIFKNDRKRGAAAANDAGDRGGNAAPLLDAGRRVAVGNAPSPDAGRRITVGALTNNDRTAATLMTPN